MFAVQLATQASTCLTSQKTQLTSKQADLTLTAGEFIADERYLKTFYFTALANNAGKPSRLSGNTTQAVKLSRQPVIQVFIKCIANCGQLMNPSYRFVLTAHCKICHNMSYSWELHIDESTKSNTIRHLDPTDTMIGLRDPVLNINPNVFKSSRMETYIVVLSGK